MQFLNIAPVSVVTVIGKLEGLFQKKKTIFLNDERQDLAVLFMFFII